MRRVAVLLACGWLAACTGTDPRAAADRLAGAAGFVAHDIDARPFRLRAYLRAAAPGPVLRVYIEGDGHAWRTRQEPSADPTPWSPLALDLAVRDPFPAVAYLARPCQYVVADPACSPAFWTDRRYGEPVVASADAAMTALLALAGARRLELVGFSGGGAIAVLAAARRTDVVSLRTVAANLDTEAWTIRHDVTPLLGSLNPADVAPLLARLPQVHFVGAADRVVDEAVVLAYARRAGSMSCLRVVVVPGLGHDSGWAARWPDLLGDVPVCEEARPGQGPTLATGQITAAWYDSRAGLP
jgi:hypothetical protein